MLRGFDDQGADTVQLVGSKTTRAGELDRIEPKLGGALVAFDVDVRRLRPFCQWRLKPPQNGRSKSPHFGRSKIPQFR
jgi:hypothetical protein